jgi:uncharacterized protein
MSLIQLAHKKRDDIINIAAKRGASNPRILNPEAENDIDLLVDFEPGRSLFDLGGLLADLRDLLEPMGEQDFETYSLAVPKVHVVTEQGLSLDIRDEALREQVLRKAVPL